MLMIEVENCKDELAPGILYVCSKFLIKTQCMQHVFTVVLKRWRVAVEIKLIFCFCGREWVSKVSDFQRAQSLRGD